MKRNHQPTPPLPSYLGLKYPHKYSVITAVARTLVSLAQWLGQAAAGIEVGHGQGQENPRSGSKEVQMH